jgi:DNA-binding beta-propeller fold protein YncE
MSVPNGLEEVIVGGAPLGVVINHAGTRGYVAHGNGVSVIDLATHAVVAEFPAPHSGNNYDVEVSLDDQRIFLANEYGIYVLNAVTGAPTGRFNSVGPFSLAHHPTLARLYAVETGTGDILELNAGTLALLRRLRPPVQAGPKEIAIAPDGSELYLAAQGDQVAGQLQVWDLATGELVQQVLGPETFGVVATGPYLLVTASQASQVRIYDRLSRVLLHTVPAAMPRRPAASGNGVCFFVPAEGGQVLNICM